MASTIAIPNVPRISTYTPIWATRPMILAPAVFSVVWMASRPSVTTRMVPWLPASKLQWNRSWPSATA